MNEIRESCGLFGVLGTSEAAYDVYYGLYALQHRGQESAGIVASDGQNIRSQKGMGLVGNIFTNERRFKGKVRRLTLFRRIRYERHVKMDTRGILL